MHNLWIVLNVKPNQPSGFDRMDIVDLDTLWSGKILENEAMHLWAYY